MLGKQRKLQAYFMAITSTSIEALPGIPLAATHERAGGLSGKKLL
jgi:hypothetical protein